MDLRQIAIAEAQKVGLDPQLFLRVIGQESAWKPGARSPKGAVGLAQLMPTTARELGVDPTDPVQNLRGGATYLKQQLDRFGDPALALAAYNAGPGNVQKYGGIPPFQETQDYVKKILGGQRLMTQQGGSGRDIFQTPRRGQDIFQASQRGGSGRDIFKTPARQPPPVIPQQATPLAGIQAPPVELPPEDPTAYGDPTNIFPWSRGLVRGATDIIDAGAQTLTRGVQGLAHAVGSVLPESIGRPIMDWADTQVQDVNRMNREREALYQSRRSEDGVDWGRLGGNILAAGPMMGNPATVLAAMGRGATTAATLTPTKGAPDESAGDFLLQRAGYGLLGGVGGGVGQGLGQMVSRAANRLSPAQREIMQQAKEMGIQTTAGQRTGNQALLAMEDVLRSAPGTRAHYSNIQSGNQQRFNELALQTMGIAPSKTKALGVSGAVDDKLRGFSREYESLAQSASVRPRSSQVPEVQAHLSRAMTEIADLGGLGGKGISTALKQVTRNLDEGMSGSGWLKQRSLLSEKARAAKRTPIREAYRELTEALDTAALNTLRDTGRTDLAERFAKLNAEYTQFAKLRNAIKNDNIDMGVLSRQIPGIHMGQGGELGDLARVAQQLRQVTPDSGTAQRTAMLNLLALKNPISDIALAGTGHAYASAPGQFFSQYGLLGLPSQTTPLLFQTGGASGRQAENLLNPTATRRQ